MTGPGEGGGAWLRSRGRELIPCRPNAAIRAVEYRDVVPRRNRARRAEPRSMAGGMSSRRLESGADGEWIVQRVPGEWASKMYRCPGCDHEIRPGVAHLVVWPANETGTIEDRRHWHHGCWSARARRHPTSRRR
jgi:hypothetical protein